MKYRKKPSRRGFLKGLVSFAAAALAMPTALTDSEEEAPAPTDLGEETLLGQYSPEVQTAVRAYAKAWYKASGPYLIPFSTRDKGKTTIGPLLAMSKLRGGE